MSSRKLLSGESKTKTFTSGTLAFVMLVLAGCASAPPPVKEEKLVWPAPPETTRIKFERSIVSKDDLNADTTFSQTLATYLGGERIPEGRIAQPMALAISDDGDRLYVSDPLQHVVFTFDFKQKTLTKLEDVIFPSGIALDEQENLYVVDGVKKCVSVFGRDGKFIKDIGDGTLERPNGIAIDRVNDRIYVVDTGSSESKEQNVKIYNRAGQRIGQLGGAPGGDFGQFSYPTFATVDNKGNVYITDTLNARVQEFDSRGNFVRSFGQMGSAWGEFDKPKGVAVDSFGNVYVVDTGWSNVQIFNPKGQIMLFFGGRGPIPGMMKNPIAIVIDRNNRIYVGDYLNHRINVYQLVNTTAEDSFLAPKPNPSGTQDKGPAGKPSSDTEGTPP